MTAQTHRERAAHIVDDALARFRGEIALACSFGGPTGMVLLDMVVRRDPSIPVYFLDTGLLFPETYALVDRVRERYGIAPVAVKPELSVQQQNEILGDALWARDPDACCNLRKVEPQRRFLAGFRAWMTGLRREQSSTRAAAAVEEMDAATGTVKIAPLVEWSGADVRQYIAEHDVPYNPLNDRGYPSLGCTHCTRAVAPGEDSRAGRWSAFTKRECGLHARPSSGVRTA